MALFILVKRNRKLLGVIPAKKKATKAELNRLIRTQIRKGFNARVVNLAQLKTILKKMLPARAKRILRQSKVISTKRRKRRRKQPKRRTKRRR